MKIGLDPRVQAALQRGIVIPACPLALTAQRKLDDRRQRALIRYYLDAGVGGLAVGVHTSQFAIRDASHGLFRPVLRLVADEINRAERLIRAPIVRIAGVCGTTDQALAEAAFIRECDYHAALLSLGALMISTTDELLAHCRAVAEVIPIIGFYLQPAAGGRLLPYSFWRQLAEIDNVVAIKIAPFNRYQTLDVLRAVAESGRGDLALYTGNDDHIVLDLISPFRFQVGSRQVERRIVGGLLGQWAVWTRKAVELLAECQRLSTSRSPVPVEMLNLANEITDANGVIFDVANNFAGCIPGIHEILRRQGLLDGVWCLDPDEKLSPGQGEAIDRIYRAYPHLNDDAFVRANLDRWLQD